MRRFVIRPNRGGGFSLFIYVDDELLYEIEAAHVHDLLSPVCALNQLAEDEMDCDELTAMAVSRS